MDDLTNDIRTKEGIIEKEASFKFVIPSCRTEFDNFKMGAVRPILTALFLCLTILCGIVETASGAAAGFGQKTASGSPELNPDIYTYELGSLGQEPCWFDEVIHYDPATGVLYYVRQNPWTAFDPLGLKIEYHKDGEKIEKPEEIDEALDYLNQSPLFRDIWSELDGDDENTYIIEITAKDTSFDGGKTISWDPSMAILSLNLDGTIRYSTPARNLFHEVLHLYRRNVTFKDGGWMENMYRNPFESKGVSWQEFSGLWETNEEYETIAAINGEISNGHLPRDSKRDFYKTSISPETGYFLVSPTVSSPVSGLSHEMIDLVRGYYNKRPDLLKQIISSKAGVNHKLSGGAPELQQQAIDDAVSGVGAFLKGGSGLPPRRVGEVQQMLPPIR